MTRSKLISYVRNKISRGIPSIGSWMQLNNSSVAEIMGHSGYDWIVIDMEHGSIDVSDLPDLCRAIELGNSLPLVRLRTSDSHYCKIVLDSGAGGIVIPNLNSSKDLESIASASRWPPVGKRGVGFSRANLFGKKFDDYRKDEALNPIIIGMIETIEGLKNIQEILSEKILDAVIIGPYDLSASLGITGDIENNILKKKIEEIKLICDEFSIPCGIHITTSDKDLLLKSIKNGFKFIPYCSDGIFFVKSSGIPIDS